MKMQKTFAAVALALGLAAVTTPAARADTADKDKKFLEESSVGNMAEIKMAKLALANSQNKDVRAFASKMIHDHTMLGMQMKPFAAKMGVPAPTKLASDQQAEYDRLAGKKGESFDKDYVQTMVDDHHKDLKEFTEERDSTDNASLKAAVAKGTTVIEQHTRMIDDLGHKMSLNVPSGM